MGSKSRIALVAAVVVLLYGFLSNLLVINYLWGILSAAGLIFLAANFQPALAAAVGGFVTLQLVLFQGLPQSTTFLLSICLPALLIGYLARRHRGGFRAIFWGLIPALALVGLFLTAYSEVSTSVSLTIEAWLDEFALQASEMGQSQELLEELTSDLRDFGRILVELLPSLLLLSVLFNLTVAYFLSCKLGSKVGYHIPPLPRFSRWRLSDYSLGMVLLGAIFSLLHNPGVRIVGHNLLAFSAGLYFFVGFSVAEFFLVKLEVPRLLKLLFYLLIFLGQVLSLILLGVLGLFDSWFDFRKLRREVAVSA
ncbi:MAG: hypothetical protein AMJ41_00410 [candidate division Zixibacteria bacterium DG_27]|nr:MAG: hypothetical protein AMJ41_00410 [candidate division Zixibacteria bacterium DG_27]